MRKILALLILSYGIQGFSQVESQWRGANRDGIYYESGLLDQWPAEGPDRLWLAADLGGGHSSAALGKNLIYITGRKGEDEYLTALNYQGEQQWQVRYGRAWNKSYPDTRTTPALVGDRVYLISGMGEVACHDAVTGEQLWMVNAFEEYQGVCNLYGISESPLVVGDLVYYTTGGFETNTIALNRHTGALVWKTKPVPDSAAYVSPFYADHNGRKMIINLMADWAVGIDPESGEFLWKYNYIALESGQPNEFMKRSNCNTPLYHQGEVFLNKGYNHPSAMLSLNETGTQARLKWINTDFDTHVGGYVLVDGYLYGSTWTNNGQGDWACISWETGETKWVEPWHNKGSIIYADGLVYIYEEKRGNLALVRPNPEKLEIISTFRITEGSGPHWSHPVIREGILYVRHGEVLMAYDIRRSD